MIEVERLTKHYGPVAAIRDVSFNVAPGQIVGFLGPNGAGKSTTMRILACFMPASSGRARVAGHDVLNESMEVRRRIGYLPENVPLYTDMRVAPYLDFVAEGPIDRLVEQFFPTARVEVEIVGPAPAVRERIRAIAGVLSVQDLAGANGAGRFVVEAARDRDVRSEIFRMAAQQRWELLELKRVGMTLEEVFIRIVAGEESEEAPRS